MNDVGADPHLEIVPRTLSHVVYLVPDAARAEAFYVDRLGFRVTDRFRGVGPFLRPRVSETSLTEPLNGKINHTLWGRSVEDFQLRLNVGTLFRLGFDV